MENFNLSDLFTRAFTDLANCALSDQLIKAIKNRDTQSTFTDDIQKLIDQGADVNRRDYNEKLPLYWACFNSDIYCVKLLLDNGARVDVSELTALPHFAATDNNINCVKLLLQYGADTNLRDSDSRAPLHWAASINNIEIVKLLLQNGADVNVCDRYYNRTPLYWAAYRKNIECVKTLLQHGAKIDMLDDNHDTPLNLAACDCHLEMIKTLLEYNANVNNKNLHGQTPLMQAAINTEHNVACLELLIQASGQFDLRDKNGDFTLAIPYCDDDSKRELSELILPYCVNPRSLKELCRYQIRLSLHYQFLPDVLPTLNLPKVLARFVLLQ